MIKRKYCPLIIITEADKCKLQAKNDDYPTFISISGKIYLSGITKEMHIIYALTMYKR